MRIIPEYMNDFPNLRRNGCFGGLKFNGDEPVVDAHVCRFFIDKIGRQATMVLYDDIHFSLQRLYEREDDE